jgi:hypothetical protein
VNAHQEHTQHDKTQHFHHSATAFLPRFTAFSLKRVALGVRSPRCIGRVATERDSNQSSESTYFRDSGGLSNVARRGGPKGKRGVRKRRYGLPSSLQSYSELLRRHAIDGMKRIRTVDPEAHSSY